MRTRHKLDREQLKELERSLRSSRARLERSMGPTRTRRIARRARGALAAQGDVGSSLALTLSAGTLARHQELVGAIRRLEAGTYGICQRCESAIDYERLASDPEVVHCAECAARIALGDPPSASH
jgi:DnaK suppressor protein